MSDAPDKKTCGPREGWTGTADESSFLKELLAPGLGVSSADVSDLGPLLLGPMARGAEVSMR